MASLSQRKNGCRMIQFVGTGGTRRTIYLGKMPQQTAERIRLRVEFLTVALINGTPIDTETAKWLATADASLVNKLAAVDLCPRREAMTLGPFVERYIEGRTDVKPATREIWGQGKRSLLEHFGENRDLRKVTPGDADAYRLKLTGGKLAAATAQKRLRFGKLIFRAAVRHKLIESDPFADVNIAAALQTRWHFVTHANTAKLVEACPDRDWRAIVALARYGGLRCPSEVLSLKLADIDWAHDRMRVTSPKTEHHPGKESRIVPLFPELRPILLECAENAPEGAVYIVDERFRRSAVGEHGWRNCNLRTTFEKIINRAGLTAWPRLFHNLRSSRQTELCEVFPSHVVCAWLGNSEDVARGHYLQVTDDHMARAAGALQNALRSAPANARHASPPKSENVCG